MSVSSARVSGGSSSSNSSTSQTSIPTSRLPLELQQQVFAYLDPKSFYAARAACRSWRYASTDVVPLARQLRKLPILPPVEAAAATPSELHHLFNRAARTLMLGVRTERADDTPGTHSRVATMGFAVTPRVLVTAGGERTVTLNGRMIATFDTSGEQARLVMERPVNDLKETLGSGPWLKVNPTAYNELALSSDGGLLAIAQERTIQIYDLTGPTDGYTVNEYMACATGHYICGLDFEQDDHVLRVRLSGKGTVVYLGTPRGGDDASAGPAQMEHWKSRAGLKHVFLDSSLLQLPPGEAEVEAGRVARVCGVQLLQPFEGGWLFAGQQHGGGESSHYVLGHVRTTSQQNGLTTAQPHQTMILARLESFLSSWKYTLEATPDGGLGLWENMPSAHEHHPRFVLTSSGTFNFLGLAERDKKRIRPTPLTQLFVYRVPTHDDMRARLQRDGARGRGPSTTTCPHTDDDADDDVIRGEDRENAEARYSVPRIPLCLSTLPNDVTDLRFSTVDDHHTCLITASTTDVTSSWLVRDV